MKNKIYLDFSIRDFNDITHDEITTLIGIQPVKIHMKGHKRNPNNKNSPLITSNNWFMSSGISEYSSFDDHINSLLNILESKIDVLQPICERYYCEFLCAFYTYKGNNESTPWIYLDKRYNQLIARLNIAFVLDLYVL